MTSTAKPKLNPLVKIALDLGPLLIFFAANSRFGIFTATGIFMAAIVASLAVSYALTRHVAIMPVVSALIVLVFGSLTLVMHDETFIKVKPTIIYALFGVTLLAGYALGQSTKSWTVQGHGFAAHGSASISGQSDGGPIQAAATIASR